MSARDSSSGEVNPLLCQKWLLHGSCTSRGCGAHSLSELDPRILPPTVTTKYRISLCRFWLLGECRDPNCRYAHGCTNLQLFEQARGAKDSLCTAWLFRGSCQQHGCGFAHGVKELEGIESNGGQICTNWFVRGVCPDGARCLSNHVIGSKAAAVVVREETTRLPESMYFGGSATHDFFVKRLLTELEFFKNILSPSSLQTQYGFTFSPALADAFRKLISSLDIQGSSSNRPVPRPDPDRCRDMLRDMRFCFEQLFLDLAHASRERSDRIPRQPSALLARVTDMMEDAALSKHVRNLGRQLLESTNPASHASGGTETSGHVIEVTRVNGLLLELLLLAPAMNQGVDIRAKLVKFNNESAWYNSKDVESLTTAAQRDPNRYLLCVLDDHNNTIVHYAAQFRWTMPARQFIIAVAREPTAHAALSARNDMDWRPVFIAAACGNIAAFSALLPTAASKDVVRWVDKAHSRNLLLFAILGPLAISDKSPEGVDSVADRVAIVRRIIEDKDLRTMTRTRDSLGNTPLHTIANNINAMPSSWEQMWDIVARESDGDVRNIYGQRASDIAEYGNRQALQNRQKPGVPSSSAPSASSSPFSQHPAPVTNGAFPTAYPLSGASAFVQPTAVPSPFSSPPSPASSSPSTETSYASPHGSPVASRRKPSSAPLPQRTTLPPAPSTYSATSVFAAPSAFTDPVPAYVSPFSDVPAYQEVAPPQPMPPSPAAPVAPSTSVVAPTPVAPPPTVSTSPRAPPFSAPPVFTKPATPEPMVADAFISACLGSLRLVEKEPMEQVLYFVFDQFVPSLLAQEGIKTPISKAAFATAHRVCVGFYQAEPGFAFVMLAHMLFQHVKTGKPVPTVPPEAVVQARRRIAEWFAPVAPRSSSLPRQLSSEAHTPVATVDKAPLPASEPPAPQAPQVDQNLAVLLSKGYPVVPATAALKRAGNNLHKALDYLEAGDA